MNGEAPEGQAAQDGTKRHPPRRPFGTVQVHCHCSVCGNIGEMSIGVWTAGLSYFRGAVHLAIPDSHKELR